MQIELIEASKKFGSTWVFKNLNLTINNGEKLCILGGNGSGKSTLLKTIAGYYTLTNGSINHRFNNTAVAIDLLYKELSIATPYTTLYEEMTFEEAILFQQNFKPWVDNLTKKQIVEISELENINNKAIKNFSSGMKQRAKLTLAILADCPLLLLDEPLSNLDEKATIWFTNIINTYASHKTLVLCSNSHPAEMNMCGKTININQFK